jgi:type I restriction enzyme S subunit
VSDLPGGWTPAPIGALVSLNPKTNAPDTLEAGFSPMPMLGVDYLSPVGFETRQWGDIRKSYTHFADGDVLLAKITPCFENGKAGLARGLPNGIAAGSSEYFVCRPSVALDPRYLLAFLKTESFMREGETRMTGSVGHKRVPKDYLLGTPLPLAPLAEQQRIADKLDALLARVDACRTRLDRVPAILKRFRQAVLSAAVSGALTEHFRVGDEEADTGGRLLEELRSCHAAREQSTNGRGIRGAVSKSGSVDESALVEWTAAIPDTWALARGADVVEPGADIVYGIVQPGPKLASGVPYVRGMDIENGKILVDQLLRTSPEIAQRYARAAIRGGDVLLGIIRATKVAIVPGELDGANITQGTARFRPSRAIRTRYLATVLEAPEIQRWLHAHYRGIDMPGLNLADVRRVPVPLPPLAEQDEIVRRVESLFAMADALKANYESASSRVERLNPALLAKAFRGELVPQDPNDEPATALLERLHAAPLAATHARPPAQRRRDARAPAARAGPRSRKG